jgi:hypothetical protein
LIAGGTLVLLLAAGLGAVAGAGLLLAGFVVGGIHGRFLVILAG